MGQACARNSRNILEKNDDFKEIIVSYKILGCTYTVYPH